MAFQFLKERQKLTEHNADAFISVIHHLSFARVKDASDGPHCGASVSPDSNPCPHRGKKALIYAYMKAKLLDFELGFAIHNLYVHAKER